MIETLRAHIIKRLNSEVDSLDKVLTTFRPLIVKRNGDILVQGNICNYVYFIVSGCLQVFVYDKDMNETTRDLVIEDNWCSELISFGTGQPATENIRAVEPSQLLAINRQDFQNMMQTVPEFDRMYRQILEVSYANSVYRINTFVSLSALDRIRWLMDYRPQLMTRLSSKLIASYLGISQETFSRLKAKL